jgi:hypothetical protein
MIGGVYIAVIQVQLVHFEIGPIQCEDILILISGTKINYFLPKNDMIFPCPGLAPLPLATLTAGFFLGAGSSSEKDSHVASSRVTVCS